MASTKFMRRWNKRSRVSRNSRKVMVEWRKAHFFSKAKAAYFAKEDIRVFRQEEANGTVSGS